MAQYAVQIKTQAQANQLMSIVHSNNVRTIDSRIDSTGVFVPYTKPFRIGAVAVFWTYPSELHFSQYTAEATQRTIEQLPDREYVSVSTLAQAFSTLK